MKIPRFSIPRLNRQQQDQLSTLTSKLKSLANGRLQRFSIANLQTAAAKQQLQKLATDLKDPRQVYVHVQRARTSFAQQPMVKQLLILLGLVTLISSVAYAAIGSGSNSGAPASELRPLSAPVEAQRPAGHPVEVAQAVPTPVPTPFATPVPQSANAPLDPSAAPSAESVDKGADKPADKGADKAAEKSASTAPQPLGPECRRICDRVRANLRGHSRQLNEEYQIWQLRLGVKTDVIRYPQGFSAAEELLQFMATYYVTKAPANQMDPSFLTFMMGKCFPESYIDTDRARLSGLVNTIWLAENVHLRREQEELTTCH